MQPSYQTGIYTSKNKTCETHDSLCLHHCVGPLCGSCSSFKKDQKKVWCLVLQNADNVVTCSCEQ